MASQSSRLHHHGHHGHYRGIHGGSNGIGFSLDQKTLDGLLRSYMRGRGFNQPPGRFKKEAKMGDLIGDVTLSSHTSLLHVIASFSRRESSPEHYIESYKALQAWLDQAIDVYRFDMHKVMWPLLVQVFLDLVRKNFIHEAQKLLESNIRLFKKQHVKEITSLQKISSSEDIRNNPTAKLYLDKKTKIEMSQFSHHLLFTYLEEANHMLLLSLLNEHVQITATAPAPLSRKDIESASKSARKDSELEKRIPSSDLKLWGVVRPRTVAKKQVSKGYGGAILTSSSLDTSILLKSRQSDSQRHMVDFKTRALLGKKARGELDLPSVCMYSFLHGEATTTACVARDASLCAAGYSDSTLRYWNLKQTQDQSIRVTVYDDKCDGGDDDDSRRQTLNPNSNGMDIEGSAVQLDSRGRMDGGKKICYERVEHICGDRPGQRKLVGHQGPVFSACFSSDNQFILSASQDSTARLWSCETGLGLGCYKAHTFPVWDASFSSVGYYFATASMDTTARLWTTHRGVPVRLFAGHRKDVNCVRFHPNCNMVATGSDDQTLRIWDIQSGDAARLFRGHKGGVRCVAMAPNGRVAASGGDDGKIFLWDLPEGKRIGEMRYGHDRPVLSLDFSDDGGMLASGSMDCSMCLWDVRRPEGWAKPLKKFSSKNTHISFVKFTSRNLVLASGVRKMEVPKK